MEQMRSEFESWWEKWCGEAPFSGWENLRSPDGYNDQDIDMQWEAWQAGRNEPVNKLLNILDRHAVELGWGERPITLAELVIARDGSDELESIRAAGLRVKEK